MSSTEDAKKELSNRVQQLSKLLDKWTDALEFKPTDEDWRETINILLEELQEASSQWWLTYAGPNRVEVNLNIQATSSKEALYADPDVESDHENENDNDSETL